MTTLTVPAAPDVDTAPDSVGAERSRSVRMTLRLAGSELRLLLREPVVAVSLLGFPVVAVLVLAGVFGQAPDPEFGGVSPSEHYIAGYVGIVLAALGLITIPVHLATQRELGVRRRFRAAGLGAGVLVGSEIILGVVLGTLASAIVLALGTAVYGLQAPVHPLGVLGWFAVGLACFISVGVALGSVLRTGRSASALGNLVFVPLLLLGGGGPPRSVMPGTMRSLSDALPLSHVVGGLRQSWLGATDGPHALWWPLLVAVIAVGVAMRAARRQAG